MASSPPLSPSGPPPRPVSAMVRPAARSLSRMSVSSKHGGGSRASDDDGKTSVKVAVRVRPPLKPSDPGFELIPQRFQRSMAQVTSPTSLAVDSPQGRKLFVFDRVFGEDVDQEGVWDYIQESVNAFVQGYNVSILAYGQSGSGKSYTMGTSGPTEQNDSRIMGVIPRAASSLFDKLGGGLANGRAGSGLRTPTRYSMASPAASSSRPDKDWVMKATYVEIYNEQLRDLLLPESTPHSERGAVAIREDTKGRILLTGLHQVTIHSIDDLLGALNFGSMIRQTDATAINAKSSRSHAVFSLNLVQRRNRAPSASGQDKRLSVPLEAMTGADGWVTVDSKLHFVDLAGSERLKNTGAQGERAKEGISINAGLASLGKVISQLSSRQSGSHVSYRDSKLTRLLQDSLGGNAITYMIACVTPAEFHISETLNTVQYAQRARAIQSKPRIQQVADDGDKQALIDRLRAEVAFLREQIRNAERADKRGNAPQERAERSNEREMDLQNQLLDIQENYTALSGRHAKLISEIARARDTEASQNDNLEGLEGAVGDSAVERLNRSNSFAEAVEQVVLEYEKTIQSLETSLSSTRSSLSATESSLLEKETKCAYVETVNQQLQARVQKMMDRESSTENYLHDLEAKLDGHTSGEEKNSAIVVELRKEIARVRENEASCEDYISTLEERLAESDQDVELMQREIERLEHVVERQRSLGKLDNLLHDLDHAPTDGERADGGDRLVNGRSGPRTPSDTIAEEPLREASGDDGYDTADEHDERAPTAIPDERGEHDERAPTVIPDEADDEPEKAATPKPAASIASVAAASARDYPPQSPAQSKFVAEKLENVTQELFDLRVEHESTVNEFDLLAAKYEESLRTLAELRDAVDEARHPTGQDNFATPASTRPTSFLEDARVSELKDGEQISSSRSLSSELFSAGVSPSTTDPSELDGSTRRSDPTDAARALPKDDALAHEVESLRRLQADKDRSMRELTQQYAQLQDNHQDTLDLVEELKAEVQKAKMNGSPAPSQHVIRRKSSQNVMIIDRAHRSFASLRNIATENFDERPDVMQNFELNLNTAMHELHSRSERVQELEADIASVKKEMEAKMTIISGLTRERSSMKNSSPMDISVVSTMRDQLLRSEDQIRVLQESHAGRERDLRSQIEELKAELTAQRTSSGTDSATAARGHDERTRFQERRISELEEELSHWETRHQSAVSSMQTSEKQLLRTVGELESAMSNVEALRVERAAEKDAREGSRAVDLARVEKDSAEHEEVVSALRREIEEHKSTVDSHVERAAELEKSLVAARKELDDGVRSRTATEEELDAHRELVSNLQEQISQHRTAIGTHDETLTALKIYHAEQVKEHGAARCEAQSRLAEQAAQYEERVNNLHAELTEAKDEMGRLLQGVATILEEETATNKLPSQINALKDRKVEAEANVAAAEEASERANAEAAKLRTTVAELTTLNEESVREIERLNEEYRKSSRIVEELEDQLSSNFDQHQAANNRLSTLETERHHQLAEANVAKAQALAELEAVRDEIARLEAKSYNYQMNGTPEERLQRSNSFNSNLRKSASAASLPSPPPAIPLPPLPNNAANANGAAPTQSPTPTGSRHPSKDLANTQLAEDQEARIRTIEKHLFAEKQLTSTLEEALVDLETQGKKVKEELEGWKKKAWACEDEIEGLKKNQKNSRYSMQAVEEERNARRQAEAAKAQLEERMIALNKRKKKGTLNCF
ncbi:MAG: hypothetical protein M1832_003609 [Thelocarpon impressellum]|nr:MAG: hypothetical protein M1832_003609 [Thelocarpon impressellum]